ncbi:2-dehydro-3-deoxygalactonokinase [Thalassobius sp. MITS945101]|uniref:2-dehydro-3-deoxygalactonokinase n=1 Tax=Thalassobius sp. MITS945101 TaxID=3096994 RepID=UPI00399C1E56
MSEQHWIGVVEELGKRLAWEFAGDAVVGVAQDGAAAAQVVTFDEGPVQTVPTSLVAGGALQQSQPQGLLPMAARLALAGLCRTQKDWDGVACVVLGDRSHWVQISADEAVSFQSYLSPALAATLGAKGPEIDADALGDTLSRPERLATQLSSAELTRDSARLLGHLLGAELAATRPYWLGQRVALIAEGPMQQGYAAGFKTQGLMLEQHDLRDLQQQGMIAFNTQHNAV